MALKQAKGSWDRILEELTVRSWWVVLVVLLCYMAYEGALLQLSMEVDRLEGKLLSIRNQRGLALERQEDLLLQIQSQSDHAWIELCLMKGLGLSPEGWRKVYFTQSKGEQRE